MLTTSDAMCHECHGVIANLMPFRRKIEPDSGTCFKIGAAIALGKPVGGYLTDGLDHYADKVVRYFGALPRDATGMVFDKEFGMMIEMTVNCARYSLRKFLGGSIPQK